METSIRLRGTPPGAPNSALAGRGWRTHTGGIDTVRWHGYRGSMRGESEQQLGFSLVRPDLLVPEDHPIRTIKVLADAELRRLSPVFDQMYSRMGRPSIPPEHLLKGCLLMCLYSIRSERQLCERLRYDMLFRFFLELQVDGATFDPSGFAHNRDRLLQADVARLFFERHASIHDGPGGQLGSKGRRRRCALLFRASPHGESQRAVCRCQCGSC